MQKELSPKWSFTRFELRIRNPVYVPSQAEIHLVLEFAKDIVATVVLTIQALKLLKKRLPWIKKPKARARTRKKARRR